MSEMKALRDAYGETLAELGEKYDNLYVLDADLSKSTKTAMNARCQVWEMRYSRQWGQ